MTNTNPISSKRKKLILETAATLFIEKGFHQTSIRDIANAAKISLGNVYNHFSSKNELIASIALLEAEQQIQLESILTQRKNPTTRLTKFITHFFQIYATADNAAISAEILAEMMRRDTIADGFIKNQDRLSDKLSAVLIEGKENHEFNFESKSFLLAQSLLDLLESASIKSVFMAKNQQTDYLRHTKKMCMQLLIPN